MDISTNLAYLYVKLWILNLGILDSKILIWIF